MALPFQNSSTWALVACAVSAVSEAVISGTGVKSRFRELRLPKGTPPLWGWTVIGAAYYILFFFLLRSLLDRRPILHWPLTALVLAMILLAANAGWNWIFFHKKDCWLSVVAFVPYLALAAALAAVLYRIRSPLIHWYAFYFAYLLYAAWWAYRLWLLNRDTPRT